MAYTFEICAVNIQSCFAAAAAGAQRVELCSALDAGGITPSPGLILSAIRDTDILVNVLIRPREGNFCYDDQEFKIMLNDIRFCREAGANGVVVGALDADGNLDMPKLEAMHREADGMEIAHHRAFDFCANPELALEQLIELGYKRVLSSGQSDSAFEGRFMLHTMVAQAAGRISIMPGAGINATNIQEIARISGAQEFHFTGKVKVEPGGNHSIRGLDEWYWQSEAGVIREIIESI